MASTITIAATTPSSAVVGTDEVTVSSVLQHLQRMKLFDGTVGGTSGAAVLTTAPVGTEGGLVTRNIPDLSLSTLSLDCTGTNTVQASTRGAAAMAIDVRGVWTGTIQFEGTLDGTNWSGVVAISADGGGPLGQFTITSYTTSNRTFIVSAAPFQTIRCRVSSIGTGTATITMVPKAVGREVFLLPGSATVITDPNTSWYQANVKTGSTPAAAGDNSLVVALSPNSPLPTYADSTLLNQALSMAATTNAVTLAAAGGRGTAAIQITGGTWTGTLIFEAQIDGSNWVALPAVNINTGVVSQTTTANGIFQADISGLQSFRVRCSATGANSATVSLAHSMSDAMVSIESPLPAGTNRLGLVRPVDSADADLTTAKGTQTSRFVGTQDAKDSGRVAKVFTATFTSTATAETLVSYQVSADGGALSGAATTYQVTAGKRFRIQAIAAAMRAGGSAPAASTATLRMRINAGGAVATSSPLQGQQFQVACPTVTTAAAANFPSLPIMLPDGWELPAGANIGFTLALTAWTSGSNTPVLDLTLFGYEY